MKFLQWSVIGLVLCGVLVLAPACTAEHARSSDGIDRIQRVEEGILPVLVADQKAGQLATIHERMAFYGVPGVSIAVITDGKVDWARGYGVVDAGRDEPVTETTLFQAASMSKPVAAAAALHLVQGGQLTLDDDVNGWLRTWNVPENDYTEGSKVTVRRLLAHNAGLNVHGFPGYAAEATVPTLQQILDGEPPANTAPIRVTLSPGFLGRYSGGGYTVLQQLLIDVTGQPFSEFVEEAVLEPLGMKHSTFAQPIPESRASAAATAHLPGGVPVEGRYHVYPEKAAAGLWTTPSDLARFVISMQETAAGNGSTVLNESMAREMLTRHSGAYGLGPALESEGEAARFGHGGANHGFSGHFVAYVESGQGAVVMTNGHQSFVLVDEIIGSIARVYDWPDYPPIEQQTFMPLDAEHIQQYAGRYEIDAGFLLAVVADGDRLFAEVPGQGRSEIYASSPDTFFSPGLGVNRLMFGTDSAGGATHIIVGPPGQEQMFLRVE